MSNIVQDLRDFPAIDPRTCIIAVDPLPEGYNIIPRTIVLDAADEIARLQSKIAELSLALEAPTKEEISARYQLAEARKALEESESSFESIRQTLVDVLNEPGRSAFWRSVEARDAVRKIINAYRPALTGETGK